LEERKKVCKFASRNINNCTMAEKEYPKYEEESGMAKEPVAAVAYQREMISDIEDNIPIAGPDSWDKAMADIEQSERDFAEGKYSSWNEVRNMMADRINNYAN
jgi:hypothetical protein